MMDDFPQEFLEIIRQIKGKRSQIVVQHILEHGFITTEELESVYGYKHPPRAIRDVREQGIPIETFRVKNSQNRDIAAYRFGDIQTVNKTRIGGRKFFKKITKQTLIAKNGLKCAICNQPYPEQFLQIDHKVPYEVAGDLEESSLDALTLVCASCNRSKSWVCEHCDNWLNQQNESICLDCFWATPQNYSHIAMKQIRRLELIWQDNQINQYEWIKTRANEAGQSLEDYIKTLIAEVQNKSS
mgnify:CR=1 FL=1